jgi:putative PIG3 family NAD(P)H quinone oxidoreductase
MKAIVIDHPGDEDVLHLRDVPSPPLPPAHVRIAVRSTAVNRADLLQRRGLYPPPPGASEILGLECAGVIAAVGEGVERWQRGDRVMALLPGGGYAEEAVAHAGSVMRVPSEFSDEEAGAFPEAFLTAFLNLFRLGRGSRGESVLIHGGGSGVGTAAIQLCREREMRIFTTVGSEEKRRRSEESGATRAINYREDDFVRAVMEATENRGVDLILDHLGGPYLSRNVSALAMNGRLILIGTMGGSRGEIDVSTLLARRATVIGSTLRSRSNEEKEMIVHDFVEQFGAALEGGRLRPIIHRTFPLAAAPEAHRLMASSEHFGKIALRVS